MNFQRTLQVVGPVAAAALVMSLFLGCSGRGDGHLRGAVSPSKGGQTYLRILAADACPPGELIVDGQMWPHASSTPVPVEPGVHTVNCGPMDEVTLSNGIAFDVPAGVVFAFDYWGP